MALALKRRVYDVLVETDDDEIVDRIVAVFLMILIVLNAGAVIAESDEGVAAHFAPLFNSLELFSIAAAYPQLALSGDKYIARFTL